MICRTDNNKVVDRVFFSPIFWWRGDFAFGEDSLACPRWEVDSDEVLRVGMQHGVGGGTRLLALYTCMTRGFQNIPYS